MSDVILKIKQYFIYYCECLFCNKLCIVGFFFWNYVPICHNCCDIYNKGNFDHRRLSMANKKITCKKNHNTSINFKKLNVSL